MFVRVVRSFSETSPRRTEREQVRRSPQTVLLNAPLVVKASGPIVLALQRVVRIL